MKTDTVARVSACAVTVVFAYKILIAVNLNFVMDEFVEMNMAGMLGRGLAPFVDFEYVKPMLMQLALSPLFNLTDKTIEALLIGRFTMIGLSAVLFGCVFVLARDRFGVRAAWFALLLLALCTTEIERSLKIRTDNVTVTLFMISIAFSLAGQGKLWKLAIAGITIGAAPLATQKAVYFVAAMAPVLFWRATWEENIGKRGFALFAVCASLPAIGYLLYLYSISSVGAFFRSNVLDAATTVGAGSARYEFLSDFYTILFLRDPLFWALGLAAVAYGLVKVDWSDKRAPVFWAALIVTAGLIFHNRPWPYFFVTIAPMFAIAGGWALCVAYGKIPAGSKQNIFVVALVAALATGALYRAPKMLAPTNMPQRALIESANDILDPDHTYFDGIGMLFNRKQADRTSLVKRKVDAIAADPSLEDKLIGRLEKEKLALIIYNYRLRQLPGRFQDFVKENYLPLTSFIWTSGKELKFAKPGCVSFRLISPGAYVIGGEGKMTLDGAEVSGHADLGEGEHSLCVTGAPQTVILRYMRKGSGAWRKIPQPKWIFLGYKY